MVAISAELKNQPPPFLIALHNRVLPSSLSSPMTSSLAQIIHAGGWLARMNDLG